METMEPVHVQNSFMLEGMWLGEPMRKTRKDKMSGKVQPVCGQYWKDKTLVHVEGDYRRRSINNVTSPYLLPRNSDCLGVENSRWKRIWTPPGQMMTSSEGSALKRIYLFSVFELLVPVWKWTTCVPVGAEEGIRSPENGCAMGPEPGSSARAAVRPEKNQLQFN